MSTVIVIFSYFVPIVAISLLFYIFRQKSRYDKTLEDRNKILQVIKKVNRIILEEVDFEIVTQKVADAIPNELNFATGIVAILDTEKGTLKRVAASRTKEAREAIKALKVPFNKIEISVNDPHNLMAAAIREKRSFVTSDVYDVLGPVLSREEAQQIQRIMSTKTTIIHPIYMENKPIGVFLASTAKTKQELSSYEMDIIQEFVNGAAIALQHAILYKNVKDKTEALRMANGRLKELDRLKDDFVSIASHELRTPMTAIRSYAWMALNRADVPLSEKMKRYLSRTLISTERLINLVNDMLNISRIESGRIEIMPCCFDIKALVADVAAEIDPKLKEKQLILRMVETNLPEVFADQDKVHQVLLNLLGNALKFTPNGGTITITFFSDGQVVETAIKDNGVGISKEDLSRLFQKFGRLDNSYVAAATSGGSGLGLYICKSLIELMQGKIWAASEGVNKGTAFTFSLPVATREVIAQSEKYTKKVGGEAKPLEPVTI